MENLFQNFLVAKGYNLSDEGISVMLHACDDGSVMIDCAQLNEYGGRYSFNEDQDPSQWVHGEPEVWEAVKAAEPCYVVSNPFGCNG